MPILFLILGAIGLPIMIMTDRRIRYAPKDREHREFQEQYATRAIFVLVPGVVGFVMLVGLAIAVARHASLWWVWAAGAILHLASFAIAMLLRHYVLSQHPGFPADSARRRRATRLGILSAAFAAAFYILAWLAPSPTHWLAIASVVCGVASMGLGATAGLTLNRAQQDDAMEQWRARDSR